MKRRYLYLASALLWTFASYKILGRGLPSLAIDHRAWVIAVSLLVAAGFLTMFCKVSGSYIRRIRNLEGDRFHIYQFMSVKGYLVIGFMMTLGILLGRIPGAPDALFAIIYPGLGSGLAFGALRFLYAMGQDCLALK